MTVWQGEFGKINGRVVDMFTMENINGMQIKCINYGCIITKILVPDSNGMLENIVLGYTNLEEYIKDTSYFGAVIGRVAGRIAGAQFELDGITYTLPQNENQNHLHGGSSGFHNVIWDASVSENDGEATIEFTYKSPDGEEGYPGNVIMIVRYTLTNDNELLISYYGTSDKKTLLNVTNHTYFNLSGDLKNDVSEHILTIKSDKFLELNNDLLPTGEILDVKNTPFDFRKGRKVADGLQSSHSQNVLAGYGYDHPFVLSTNYQQEVRLVDQESGRVMVIETDEPSVILYTGNQLEGHYIVHGVPIIKHLGLCLETQGLPDSIHHSHFPSIVLEEGEKFNSKTKYSFSIMN
ncbi:aldose epimerase family protein [Peribacillus frigoritolerans]|uniref:aldose epimerase family protein n=1 Tax=Peribacillus frigoritolerans TaxID=450367 RepID=UPI002ECA1E18|nr:aldose epimerase family protein [Peribacillus frigoritolerans]